MFILYCFNILSKLSIFGAKANHLESIILETFRIKYINPGKRIKKSEIEILKWAKKILKMAVKRTRPLKKTKPPEKVDQHTWSWKKIVPCIPYYVANSGYARFWIIKSIKPLQHRYLFKGVLCFL